MGKPVLQVACPPEDNSSYFWVPCHMAIPILYLNLCLYLYLFLCLYPSQGKEGMRYARFSISSGTFNFASLVVVQKWSYLLPQKVMIIWVECFPLLKKYWIFHFILGGSEVESNRTASLGSSIPGFKSYIIPLTGCTAWGKPLSWASDFSCMKWGYCWHCTVAVNFRRTSECTRRERGNWQNGVKQPLGN